MLGTKELPLRVRDYHQGQQIDRIRIITEAIRVECSDEIDLDQERFDLRNHCIAFIIFRQGSQGTEQSPILRAPSKFLRPLRVRQ